MRRLFIIAVLSCLALLSLFADSSSSVLDVSAYKVLPLPDLKYTITITNYTENQIGKAVSGIASIFDVSSSISSNRTIAKAFSISVSSNLKSNITITLKFTPFVNQSDKNITMPLTYNFSVSGDNKVTGNTSYTARRPYSFARYKPSFTISGKASGAFYIAQSSDYELVFNPAATIETGTTNRNNSGAVSNWNPSTLPSTTDIYLPGLGDGQAVSASADFGLSIAERDYEAMRANTDYVTTVTITIKTL